jgi:hypothetical protein
MNKVDYQPIHQHSHQRKLIKFSVFAVRSVAAAVKLNMQQVLNIADEFVLWLWLSG